VKRVEYTEIAGRWREREGEGGRKGEGETE